VRDTEANFERWGMKSLLVAKFVPGFSTVAPPLAGATKRSTVEFLIYDTAGSFIWAGVAVAAGRVFFRQIDRVLEKLENLGWWAVAIVGLIFALIVFVKWWQRMRFMKELRVARIQPHELKEMFDRGDEPVVVDVRTSAVRKRDPRRIPNAIVADSDDIPPSLERVPPHTAIVLYCT
jgi:hypothetical protein